MRKHIILLIMLSCLHIRAWGQPIASLDDVDLSGLPKPTTAKQLRYWFDDDAGSVNTTTQLSGQHTIDASSLIEGPHTLHCLLIDNTNAVTSASSTIFMKFDNGDNGTVGASKLMYWFDDESDVKQTAVGNGVQVLDASKLIDGPHTLHYQVLCSDGQVASASSALFMRTSIDARSTTARQLRYWFDDDASTMRVVDAAQGTQTLDVSGLPTGLHTLNYQIIDSEGNVGTPYTRIFMKLYNKVVGDGQNHVTKYQYWLNSNTQAIQTVELQNTANPYQLVSLLPMQKEPIRSDSFHFEMTNGLPTVYAKNIFHIRFHDAAGYFAEGNKLFIDYNVKQEVTDATLLASGVKETTTRPAANDIKWYKFEANLGDSVAFKTSQTATVQVFSPDGKEVYSASDRKSVAYGGFHVQQTGTHYVALHDVTGSQSKISLNYVLIVYGDVNGDSAVDVADIATIIDTMAKSVYKVYADVNNDGVVDVADIASVIGIMATKAREAGVTHEK